MARIIALLGLFWLVAVVHDVVSYGSHGALSLVIAALR